MKRGLAIALSGLLAACGDDRVAGGGGIETNNTVAARLVDSTGAPVAGAQFEVRRASFVAASPGLDSIFVRGVSGEDGRIRFEVPNGRWTLESRRSGTAQILTAQVAGSSHLGDVALERMARLQGRIAPASAFAGRIVGVTGTGHAASVDSAGRYLLDSLPPGRLELFVVGTGPLARDTVDLAPGQTLDLPFTGAPSLRTIDSSGWIRLDDFRASLPTIGAGLPDAGWRLLDDRSIEGQSFFQRADSVRDSVWSRFLVTNSPAGKGSFRAGFRADMENLVVGTAHLEARLDLVDSTRCLDLSSLAFFRIGYTSTSMFTLGLRIAVPDSVGEVVTHPTLEISNWSDWKSYIVDPTAFALARVVPVGETISQTIPWSESSRCVQGLWFQSNRSLDFGLFDLSIYGVPLDRLLAPRVP